MVRLDCPRISYSELDMILIKCVIVRKWAFSKFVKKALHFNEGIPFIMAQAIQ